MRRRVSIASAICVLVAGGLLLGASLLPPAQARDAPAPNIWLREPVLIYDVTGHGFAGQLIHRRLSVYNDGVATVSTASDSESRAQVAFLTAQEAEDLRQALLVAGASVLVDNRVQGADIPLTTVTFFSRSAPRAGSNTFSYYVPQGRWADVDDVVEDFMATYFPGF